MPMIRKFLFLAAIASILSACGPSGPSPDQVLAQVQTSVVLTVAAQDTQTAQAQPAMTDTETATPASTETPIPVPTLAPALPLPTSTTVVVSGGGGGGGNIKVPDLSCDPDIDKRPRDLSVFAPGDHFDVKWTLLNNGAKQWCESNSCAGGPDLSYFSGPQMTAITGPIQVPPIKPGETFVVPPMDATAPSKKGTYTMTWKLQDVGCFPYVTIIVK
jgi:hypothetical protein